MDGASPAREPSPPEVPVMGRWVRDGRPCPAELLDLRSSAGHGFGRPGRAVDHAAPVDLWTGDCGGVRTIFQGRRWTGFNFSWARPPTWSTAPATRSTAGRRGRGEKSGGIAAARAGEGERRHRWRSRRGGGAATSLALAPGRGSGGIAGARAGGLGDATCCPLPHFMAAGRARQPHPKPCRDGLSSAAGAARLQQLSTASKRLEQKNPCLRADEGGGGPPMPVKAADKDSKF